MRLTNVAHLRLPFGRLMGYDVTVSGPVRSCRCPSISGVTSVPVSAAVRGWHCRSD